MKNPAPAGYNRSAIDPSFCMATAWDLFKRRPLLYIVAGLLQILVPQIPYVGFLLTAPLMGGFAFIVINDIREQPVDFGMLFKGFEKFWKLFVIGLIQAAPALVLFLAQMAMQARQAIQLPSGEDGTFFQGSDGIAGYGAGFTVAFIIVMVGYFIFFIIWSWVMYYAIPLTVEFDSPLSETVSLSFGAAFANLGGMILLGLLSFFVALLGLIALCIGIFVAIPVIYASNILAYRQVFPSGYGDDFIVGPARRKDSIFGLNE